MATSSQEFSRFSCAGFQLSARLVADPFSAARREAGDVSGRRPSSAPCLQITCKCLEQPSTVAELSATREKIVRWICAFWDALGEAFPGETRRGYSCCARPGCDLIWGVLCSARKHLGRVGVICNRCFWDDEETRILLTEGTEGVSAIPSAVRS